MSKGRPESCGRPGPQPHCTCWQCEAKRVELGASFLPWPKLLRDRVGMRAVTTNAITTGMFVIPPGTVVRIAAAQRVLRIAGRACRSCGVSVIASRMSWNCLLPLERREKVTK